ncbi:hypothetical protein DFA_03165 [Cavenderia fasciculata]|uniref:Uncharacterized protein n=1 Tax=Cavenderia fasciculata TaxID=261658 RepID=F4PGT6_CACFS|nr:uncharacterized protein DFA_03165 [Cavenderia fasciculata]EGG24920.1 hypothetical protein DFA_03165 [Cavenderia fasciculata]|eukprot:XP_004362771.1 hypothetical protein DFA_03165 [Cavenderia fasciculata]
MALKPLRFLSKCPFDNHLFSNEIVKLLADFNHNLQLTELTDKPFKLPHHAIDDSTIDSIYSQLAQDALLSTFNNNKGVCNTDNTHCVIDASFLTVYNDGGHDSTNSTPTTTTTTIIPITNDCIDYVIHHHILQNDLVNKRAVLTNRLFYTNDGSTIQTFQDCLDDNKDTLKQIWKMDQLLPLNVNGPSFIVNKRDVVYFKMANVARDHEYNGLFEIHITVHHDGSQARLETFKQVCETIKCKPVFIELPKGDSPTQMMTSSYHRGSMLELQILAYKLARELTSNQYQVTRVKIEAMFSNDGAPMEDADCKLVSPDNYFEFHIKLVLGQSTDYDSLGRLVSKHQAHLSKNAFRQLDNGLTQRFVTMRMYNVGKITAENRYNACLEDLEVAGYKITTKMREYSIYDTNVLLDKVNSAIWMIQQYGLPLDMSQTGLCSAGGGIFTCGNAGADGPYRITHFEYNGPFARNNGMPSPTYQLSLTALLYFSYRSADFLVADTSLALFDSIATSFPKLQTL